MRFILLFVLAIGASPVAAQSHCSPAFARTMNGDVRPILRRGGFGGALDDAMTTRLIGCVRSPRGEVAVLYYERIWGEAARATRRVLVVSRSRGFLGGYGIAVAPTRVTARGNVVFPYPAARGNTLPLATGIPPRRVRIDGESYDLFR